MSQIDEMKTWIIHQEADAKYGLNPKTVKSEVEKKIFFWKEYIKFHKWEDKTEFDFKDGSWEKERFLVVAIGLESFKFVLEAIEKHKKKKRRKRY